MSKTTTLQLVRNLTLFTPEEGTIDRYYDETVIEVNRFFYEVSLFPVNINQVTFTLPEEAGELMATFYDARELDKATVLEARTLSRMGRDTKGEPLIYFTQNETERTWRIAPTPTVASHLPLGFGFFGVNYPSYNILGIYTVSPQDAIDLFDLPIAHRILSREFSRDSQHQDIIYAERCQLIYQVLIAMLSMNHVKTQLQSQSQLKDTAVNASARS